MSSPATEAAARRKLILDTFDALLDVPEAERDAWLLARFADDQALLDTVKALLAADALAPTAMPTELPGASGTIIVAPLRIGPYRLDTMIGSGGMGDVWKGVRDDGLFDQDVAIKLMRPSRYAAEALGFFDTERRALARLTHPHIARLFDGGVTPEGLPWFIMELVDGEPLNEWAAERRLTTDAAVRLMIAICDAVQYAHSQLVVHADLKPSNILVDRAGAPHLVDFGIASLAQLHAEHLVDAEETQAAAFPSTPAYASPQRLKGEAPTPADDIWSLGILLSGLLTGKWPEKAGDALAPTAIADLQAIADRAVAVDARARYTTAQAMGDDLQAWREHRPIAARQGDWRYASRLFVRRHPRSTFAGIAGAVGVLVALSLISVLYVRSEHARHEAQARFDDVRSLAGYMLGDFHDELVKLPGSTALREKNATVGWQYLTRLSQDRDVPVEVTRDIAVGYGRLGNAEATTSSNGNGKVHDGDWALLQSETLLRGLVKAYPDRDDFKRELARTLAWRSGVILGAHNDPKGARAALDESFALYDGVLARHPDDLEAGYGRWNAMIGLGDLYFGADDMPALKALMEDAQARFRTLPVNDKYRSLRALLEAATENSLGDSSYYVVGKEAGVQHYKRALAIMAQARADGVMDMRIPMRQAYYSYQLSSSYQDMGQPRLALQWARAGEAIIADLNTYDDSTGTRHIRDILSLQTSTALADLGRSGEAVAEAEASVARRRTSLARQPDDMDNQLNMASGLHTLSNFYVTAKQPAKACAAARESMTFLDTLAAHGGVPERNRHMDVEPLKSFLATCPKV